MSIVSSVYYFEWFVVSVEFQFWHISFNNSIPGLNIYRGLILAVLTHIWFPVLRIFSHVISCALGVSPGAGPHPRHQEGQHQHDDCQGLYHHYNELCCARWKGRGNVLLLTMSKMN